MSDIEDEDEFLYGSDTELGSNATAGSKNAVNASAATDKAINNNDELGEEEEEEETGTEYESDSEDDIEIIVDSKLDGKNDGSLQTTVESKSSNSQIDASSSSSSSKTLPGHQESTVDLDTVPMYQGKKLTDLDLVKLESKPWRLPGADLSDYFNYGFNELTWLKYLNKHDEIKLLLLQQLQQAPLPMPPMGMPPFLPMPPQFNMFNPMMNQGANRPMMWNNNNNNMNKPTPPPAQQQNFMPQMPQMPQQQQQQQQYNDKSPTPPSNLPKIPTNAKLPQIPKMTPPPLPPPEDDRDAKEKQLGTGNGNNYRERDDGKKNFRTRGRH